MGLPFPTSTGGKIGGAGGLIGILVLVVTLVLSRGGGSGFSIPGVGDEPPSSDLPTDTEGQFAADAFTDIQDSWVDLFEQQGLEYRRAELVLFTGSTQSGCGPASSATGPFYCPADEKVYIDLDFYDLLKQQFGARGGDFAEAYVTAHEVGHHVQNLLGSNQQVQDLSAQNPDRRNELSVKLELQADCFAGVWAHNFTSREGNVIEPGDIQEAIDAAAAVGDDRIQEKTQGRVDPETWTHGSSEQRQQWFNAGYQSGDPAACDTFEGEFASR